MRTRKTLLRALLGAVLVATCVGGAGAATKLYSSGALTASVPDGGTLERVISVRDGGPVSRLAVWLRLDHPRISDLRVSLVSPDGTAVLLSSRRGGAGRNFGRDGRGCGALFTVFEDGAVDRIADAKAPFAGPHAPDGRLGALYGKEARGRWTLRVVDEQTGLAGTLHCWKLDLSRDVVEVKRAQAGPVRAELSYRERNFSYREVRLKIVRGGRAAHDRPVQHVGCGSCPGWRPLGEGRVPVAVADLEGDREPEVIVDVFTGGAHCCVYSLILRYLPKERAYKGKATYWGNYGYRLRDLDRDGVPEFDSADERFAYAFTAYVASVPPVRIWRYRAGRLADVTRRFPAEIARDARHNWAAYLKVRRSSFPEVRGILAAYLADQYLLGKEREGWQRLELAFRRGDLGRGPLKDGYAAGRAYLDNLRSFLEKHGYARPAGG